MMGNIGNQLFIYAFARQLQCKYSGERIIFDLSALKRYYYTAAYKLDSYELGDNISYDLKELGLIHRFKFWFSSKFFHLERYIYHRLTKKSTVPEHMTKRWLRRGCIYYFDRLFLDIPETKRKYKYVYGYFQSDKYFKEIDGVIRNDLTLKNELTDSEKEVAKEMKNSNSIGISIRANRTPENPKVKDNVWLGLAKSDYYYRAMKIMAEKVNNPKFFVFADSLDIVKKEFTFPYPVTFVTPNDSSSGVVLLSKCKNFIITNSTFSWWGSYLSAYKDKKVIMPNPWDRTGVYRDCIYYDNVIKLDCEFED